MPCTLFVLTESLTGVDIKSTSAILNNMDKKILKLGIKKFKNLAQNYNGFINVIIDDWRGYRFIFDTEEVRNCQNNCQACGLFRLLEKESAGLFSAGLYPASQEDKKIFGPQKYLNCKTAVQYQECYQNFLKTIKNRVEIEAELNLVRNLKFIYCRDGRLEKVEADFKQGILPSKSKKKP